MKSIHSTTVKRVSSDQPDSSSSLSAVSMTVFDLANELLLYIAEQLYSERAISASARANKRFYCLLNSYLYFYNAQRSRSSALIWAARHGQVGTAEKSLANGADLHALSTAGWRSLCLATYFEHDAVVKHPLASDAIDHDSRDSSGRTSLSWAVGAGAIR